jgi:hypothetical protein
MGAAIGASGRFGVLGVWFGAVVRVDFDTHSHELPARLVVVETARFPSPHWFPAAHAIREAWFSPEPGFILLRSIRFRRVAAEVRRSLDTYS